jgi:hypothetical protein
MTMSDMQRVKQWIGSMAELIARNEDPSSHYYAYFIQEPELASVLVQLITSLTEHEMDEDRAYYSACIFALDVCVAQLQSAQENGNKHAEKTMQQLMALLTDSIKQSQHTLMFWLPILNAFYDVHVELSPDLKDAYLDLVNEEDERVPEDEVAHLNSIRDLIHELSDLSVFDMAENFFAQSYAMPADFFSDLVLDLYSIDEGQDIGLLALLHPGDEVREVVVATLESLMPQITLSSTSLSRLQVIKAWYPPMYQDQLSRWIKEQRKKEVVFHQDDPAKIMSIKASEVDGGGAQGIFIQLKRGRQYRLCGLLFKQGVGIKDAWITPVMSSKEVTAYHEDVFDDSVMLREVDLAYLVMMTNHFLAITIEQGGMPDLHLLEIQEETGVHFLPKRLDTAFVMEELGVQISPFTPDVLSASLKRSKTWPQTKRFTESWYLENANVDKLVNRCCSFEEGVRVCRFDEAMVAVFQDEMEDDRARWVFHFVWIALWLKAKGRKTEKVWQDSFMIAYAIQTGQPLHEIPIMREICHQSVVNSIETMRERRTHLNQE